MRTMLDVYSIMAHTNQSTASTHIAQKSLELARVLVLVLIQSAQMRWAIAILLGFEQ